MSWRTTEHANTDLEMIAETGMQIFGEHHARRYLALLFDMFDRLAIYPDLGTERQAARSVVRLMPCEAHHILYQIEDEDIVILRVLHGTQDWQNLL